jgi:hypothetical protein
MATTLYINPTSFILKEGKLDASYLYINKVNSGGDFAFSVGKTMKLTYRGFVYDLADRHTYLRSDDSTFAASFMEMSYK